jgi:hypothetical protein
MTDNKCKAITESGEQCSLKAGASGYCHIHDPVKIAERKVAQETAEKERQVAWNKGEKLREVLKTIESTCHAAGWSCYTKSRDEQNWRYATMAISRRVSFDEITGILDIVLDDGVKVSLNKTSFYGHGLSLIHETVITELTKLPWLVSKKKSAKENTKDSVEQLK